MICITGSLCFLLHGSAILLPCIAKRFKVDTSKKLQGARGGAKRNARRPGDVETARGVSPGLPSGLPADSSLGSLEP